VGDGFRLRAAGIDSAADDAQVRLNGFREALQELMLDLEAATNRGAAEDDVASDKTRQPTGESVDTSDSIAGGTLATGDAFRQQLLTLGKSADEAVARVEVVL